MWEKFSRCGASVERTADSAKAIQSATPGKKRAWWDGGHAKEEYITRERFVN
jgi:hypothetical protein